MHCSFLAPPPTPIYSTSKNHSHTYKFPSTAWPMSIRWSRARVRLNYHERASPNKCMRYVTIPITTKRLHVYRWRTWPASLTPAQANVICHPFKVELNYLTLESYGSYLFITITKGCFPRLHKLNYISTGLPQCILPDKLMCANIS